MKRKKQRTTGLANHNCVGFLLGIFNGNNFIGYLFIEGGFDTNDIFIGNVVVLDKNGDYISDNFDGDVYVLAVTDNDFRNDCKSPGGSDKGHWGEEPYQTLKREIFEEIGSDIIRATLFCKEKHEQVGRIHMRNFFSIVAETLPNKEEKRYTSTGDERLKVYWCPLTKFVCCLFKNQRRVFGELLQILAVNRTFFNKYKSLVMNFSEINGGAL